VSKPVCCKGDVVATPDSAPFPGSDAQWQAGQVSYKTYSHLKVGGKEVAYEATCTFSYSGKTTSTPSSPVSGSEDITLSASSELLEKGSSKVLLNGDSKQGTTSSGNKLEVQSSQILKTD
jgi:hypothetical protein